MGNELVENPFPTTYTKQFEEVCGWYMSIGMSYDEFWEGDAVLPKYYREAYEYKNTQKNYESWLQGVYVYEAMSIVVGNALRKRGAKVEHYPDKPHPFTKLEQKYEQEQKELKEKQAREKAKAIFSTWASKFKSKKGDSK